MLQRNFFQLPKPPNLFLRQPPRRSSSSTIIQRPTSLRQTRRRPRPSTRSRAPSFILLLRSSPITLPQPREHRKAALHFLHSLFERRSVRQSTYVFCDQAQAEFEVEACETEGLEDGALGGDCGLLNGSGRRWRRGVELLLACVLKVTLLVRLLGVWGVLDRSGRTNLRNFYGFVGDVNPAFFGRAGVEEEVLVIFFAQSDCVAGRVYSEVGFERLSQVPSSEIDVANEAIDLICSDRGVSGFWLCRFSRGRVARQAVASWL
jgi:hypothetical protein